jgi:meso-butanediol dehydrogenase / (S,S)-butanediol dehydrogenase / diacetyl reductase
MADRLAGRVALVSGSTRGIGRSIAERFAAEGAKVAVAGRTVAKGEKVVARIREAGGEAAFFPLDVTDEAGVQRTIDAVADHFGGLSTLVNNAAPTDLVVQSYKPLAEYTTGEWDRILLGTLTGNVFWASKYAWPHLVKTGVGAAIVNISSGQSLSGFKGLGAYGAAKGGVNAVTRTLAVEGAEHGIRCNAIVVGRVVSSPGDSGLHTGPGHLTRLGEPMDIAHAALWLASDEAAFVTGSLVTADGGFSINGDAVGNAG